MNQKILITDFLSTLDFIIVKSTEKPNCNDHIALALVTTMPDSIPIRKQVYLNLIQDGGFEYLAQFDIEPVDAVPGWFFVKRIVTS